VYKLWSYSSCSFLQHPTTPPLFNANILNILSPNTLSLCSSLNVRDEISLPYRTTGKIIILYVLRIYKLSSCYGFALQFGDETSTYTYTRLLSEIPVQKGKEYECEMLNSWAWDYLHRWSVPSIKSTSQCTKWFRLKYCLYGPKVRKILLWRVQEFRLNKYSGPSFFRSDIKYIPSEVKRKSGKHVNESWQCTSIARNNTNDFNGGNNNKDLYLLRYNTM
jgi:hypothetical protein